MSTSKTPLARPDDIGGQLREEHAFYLAELEALGDERDAQRCKARLRELRRAWAIHALAEESVVYRPLEIAEAASALSIHADERFIEHELVENLFDKLARGRPGTLEWQARLNVTRRLVARHIEDEERDVFARLERQFDAHALARMSGEFVRERERLAHLEEPKAA